MQRKVTECCWHGFRSFRGYFCPFSFTGTLVIRLWKGFLRFISQELLEVPHSNVTFVNTAELQSNVGHYIQTPLVGCSSIYKKDNKNLSFYIQKVSIAPRALLILPFPLLMVPGSVQWLDLQGCIAVSLRFTPSRRQANNVGSITLKQN